MLRRLTLVLDTDDNQFRAEIPVIETMNVEPGTIILADAGAKKIGVIKIVRHYTGLGLKDAKEATESLPRAFAAEDMCPRQVVENPDKLAMLNQFAEDMESEGARVEVGGERQREEILMREIIGAFGRACGVKVSD